MSDKIYFFDTTLRDGEQSPGATMNAGEKLRMAKQLEKLGVDIIEAGFPASSSSDLDAVHDIANTVKDCEIAGLCRASRQDIDKAWGALKKAAQPRLHIFLATSDIHMQYKLDKNREQILEIAREAITYASGLCPRVEFSAEDASRSDPEFLVQVVQAAIASGARIINIPDTVGYAQPQEYADLIRYLIENVQDSEKAIFSEHCHNDLGLAVANTLAAFRGGARQAEVTLSGIGERAGNAALEEVVMALNVRKDFYNLETGINTEQIYPSSRLLSMIIGQPIPPYKPIIGANAFAHEAGIHQAGMLKNRQTYEIMTPSSIGKDGSDIVIGKHSGRYALNQKLEDLGYNLTEDQLTQVSEAVKRLADKKKQIYSEDVEAVVLEEVYRIPDKFKLMYLSSISGNMAIPTAALKMEVLGKEKLLSGFGVGAIDAVFNTIDRLVEREPKLLRYSVNAITGGTDAQGEVTVKLEGNGITAVGRAADPDVIVASAKAYINALNRLAKKETDPGKADHLETE